MTHKTQPTAHAEITAPISADVRGIDNGAQPAPAQQPHFDLTTSSGGRAYVAWHFANVLKRHDFTRYIHGALAADFACALARHLQAAPPAPAAVAVPAAIDSDRCAQDVFDGGLSIGLFEIPKDTANAICAGIAAATGVRVDWHYFGGRVHMKALAAAPAQAVVVPAEVELPDVEDMAHSAVQEALSFGVNHDVFHRWMRAVMDKNVQAMSAAPEQAVAWMTAEGDRVVTAATMASARKDGGAMLSSLRPFTVALGRIAAPAQEHATQLAGQGQDEAHAADMQAVGEAFMAAIEDNYAALQAAGWSRPVDCPSEIVADLLDLIAEAKAAPAQSQEDARDAPRLDFLIEKDAFIVWTDRDGSIRQCQLLKQDEDENYHVLSGEHRYFNTPREAIDAARAAQGGAA